MRTIRIIHRAGESETPMQHAAPEKWIVPIVRGDLANRDWASVTGHSNFKLAPEVEAFLSSVPHDVTNWLGDPEERLDFIFWNEADGEAFREFMTETFGATSPEPKAPRLSDSMVVGDDYWMVSDDHEHMPYLSVVRLESTPMSCDEAFFDDQDDLVYVVVDGEEGWEAAGYVKATDIIHPDDIRKAIDQYLTPASLPVGFYVWRETGERSLRLTDIDHAERSAGYSSEPVFLPLSSTAPR